MQMTEYFQIPAAAGGGVWVVRYQDIFLPKLDSIDTVQCINYAKEFEYKTGDVILCTYPKCGTHWIGNMIWKLKNLDYSKRSNDTILEYGPPEIFESMDSPRIIFTHLKPSRLPTEHIRNHGKIVLMLRNPKDVFISRYHYVKNMALYKSKHTWDEIFQSLITGKISFGSYFDYVQQWEQFIKENSDQSVEIFYYEDFTANLNDNLARLNTFLGFKRDQEYMEKVKAATTMSALRKQDASGNKRTHYTVRNEKGDSVIYRKGEVGDWKNHMTVAQSELVDKLMEERLKLGIIKFRYCI